ncbi:MAG: hypothetical protein J7K15_10170 [Deltaproteobacteria bacterium]|nr:hypothetical protein [Deltaproteobacteria bacterium]
MSDDTFKCEVHGKDIELKLWELYWEGFVVEKLVCKRCGAVIDYTNKEMPILSEGDVIECPRCGAKARVKVTIKIELETI